jgi:hypothetical protein
MMPLSEVFSYRTTEDFITAAEHLEAVAAHRESTFFDVRDRALRVKWEGVSADAVHEQMQWDSQHAAHSADDLREAARVARSGASDVDYAHRRMLYMLQDVQDDGYSVAEGYIVNNIKPSSGLLEQAQRAQKALEYSADMQYRATQFAETEARASARLQTAVAGEGKVQFVNHAFKTDKPPANDTPRDHKPQIHAVDRTFKTGPSSNNPSQDAYDKLKDAIRDHNMRYPSITAETAPGYNREAEDLNREKKELEAKLGKSETAPARMSRLVPDWAHPAPEQPQTYSPTPDQQRGLDLSTAHAEELGKDPARGGEFSPTEAQSGLRLENERDLSLIRSKDPSVDWIDPGTGKTYDAVGNFPSKFFDSQWSNLQARIQDHLEKADFVPVDVSQFTPAQRSIVREYIEGLHNPRVFMIGDN